MTKEDLLRYILAKEHITEEELIQKISLKEVEKIPLTIFSTKLFPLEAIVRYLKDILGLRVNEIAKKLHKKASAVSTAYKKGKKKSFVFMKTDILIPLSEFEKNPSLSVLEVVVSYLKKKGFTITHIAKLLRKSPKTVWTVQKRAERKNE